MFTKATVVSATWKAIQFYLHLWIKLWQIITQLYDYDIYFSNVLNVRRKLLNQLATKHLGEYCLFPVLLNLQPAALKGKWNKIDCFCNLCLFATNRQCINCTDVSCSPLTTQLHNVYVYVYVGTGEKKICLKPTVYCPEECVTILCCRINTASHLLVLDHAYLRDVNRGEGNVRLCDLNAESMWPRASKG